MSDTLKVIVGLIGVGLLWAFIRWIKHLLSKERENFVNGVKNSMGAAKNRIHMLDLTELIKRANDRMRGRSGKADQ